MSTVLYETSDGVALVTLNRPDRGNAWMGRMQVEYRAALARAEADDDVAVIVVTGAGERFCVGADAQALENMGSAGRYDDGVREPLAQPGRSDDPDLAGGHSFLWGIPKPVMAAINGAAAGVGFVLACYCDLRYADAGAKLTPSTARLGLPVEYGLDWLLPRVVGTARAAELLMTGRVVLAEEAERWGLLNGVFPRGTVLPETMAIARRMATECAPSSLRAAKEQLYSGLRGRLADSEAEFRRRLDEMIGTPDYLEGVTALVERRPPDFRTVRAAGSERPT